MVSSRGRNIRTNGRGEKKKRKRGNERRNKVLACGGFTSESMILRGLGGSIGLSGARFHRATRANAARSPSTGCGPPFYGDRFPPPSFPTSRSHHRSRPHCFRTGILHICFVKRTSREFKDDFKSVSMRRKKLKR